MKEHIAAPISIGLHVDKPPREMLVRSPGKISLKKLPDPILHHLDYEQAAL
jgi:hypothetical protein